MASNPADLAGAGVETCLEYAATTHTRKKWAG